jgi:hypothetical protein
MNTPAPGWHPDPTGRHEYRYWDGSQWTDDVSDQGATTHDPVAGPGAPTVQSTLPGAAMGEPTTAYGTNTFPPQPQRSGPPAALIVGLVILALALIGGVAFLVTSSGDDDTDTATDDEEISDASEATTTTSDQADEPPASSDVGGAGTDAMTQVLADTLVTFSDGVLTQEEGECLAAGMIDEIGVDRLIEAGSQASGGSSPFDVYTSEELSAITQVLLDCVPADKLDELSTVFGDLPGAGGG